MRRLVTAAACLVLSGSLAYAPAPAYAQTPVPAAQPAAPPQATSPQAASPGVPVRTGNTFQYRQTLDQRFATANTTQDGKLTQPQAFAARWSYATRNFDAIDTSHSGTITLDQIRSFARDRRAARQLQEQQKQPAVPTASPG